MASLPTSTRALFLRTPSRITRAAFCADVAASIVGEDRVDRNTGLVMASEDFSYMLDACPGAYINIGNGDAEHACQVHNPAYDFNDRILPLGATYWARLVETRLPKAEM